MTQIRDYRLSVGVNYTLALTETLVANAKITGIILHGFISDRHSPNTIAVSEQLHRDGINAITVDFYGRGESDGEFGKLTIVKAVENVFAVINHVHERDPEQKIILIGGSFGGLVAMHAAAKMTDLEALILRAPVSDWNLVWQDWISPVQFAEWERTGIHTDEIAPGKSVTFGVEFLKEVQAPPLYNTIAPRITVPTLIVHGDADETVPVEQSQKLHSLLPNSQLIILPGADHRFSRPEDMVQYQAEISKFLTD